MPMLCPALVTVGRRQCAVLLSTFPVVWIPSMVPWTVVALTWLLILIFSVPVSRLQLIALAASRCSVNAIDSIMHCGAGKNLLVGIVGVRHTSAPRVSTWHLNFTLVVVTLSACPL